jgi:hypothetical protein
VPERQDRVELQIATEFVAAEFEFDGEGNTVLSWYSRLPRTPAQCRARGDGAL